MKENLGNCTKCGSKNIIKNGHNAYGKQQYRCKDCKAHRILESEKKYPEARKWEIIRAYLEGSSLRGLERIFHIAYQTPSRWIKKNEQFNAINRRNSGIS